LIERGRAKHFPTRLKRQTLIRCLAYLVFPVINHGCKAALSSAHSESIRYPACFLLCFSPIENAGIHEKSTAAECSSKIFKPDSHAVTAIHVSCSACSIPRHLD